MNVWKLVGAEKLVQSEEGIPLPEEGKIRVRVTKVLLCNSDAAVFHGDPRVKYPLVFGRYAIGLVAEENDNALFPKGTRVVLHSFLPAPDSGTAKKDFNEDDYLVTGYTCDGFLRDIVYVSPDDMTPLPDAVNDAQALLLHHVAFAKAVVDTLGAQKGQHVAVIGANLTGILVCQLLIYQQAAPILVDADPAKLDFARNCGVYYTMKNDETLLDGIASVTGGRLAEGAVYITSAPQGNAESPFHVTARESRVVVGGFTPCEAKLDLNLALSKQMSLEFICNCSEYLETAINLVANKAVSIDYFRPNSVKEVGISEFIQEYVRRETRDVTDYTFVALV